MYLLAKLIALQLLLFCVATEVEVKEEWWSFTAKGGFFYKPRAYAMDENATVEFNVTYVGNADTVFSWLAMNQTELYQTRTSEPLDESSGGPHNKITTTLRFTAHQGLMLKINITRDAYFDNNKSILKRIPVKLYVQKVIGPEISLVNYCGSVDDKGGHSVMENKQFSLKCHAGGLINTTIEWLDNAGNAVIPSQVTQLGPVTKIGDSVDGYSRSQQILKVRAQKEMTSFGCRMKAPNFKSSPFEKINWFEFKVESVDTLLAKDALEAAEDANTLVGIDDILDGSDEKPLIWLIVGPLIAIAAIIICAVYFVKKGWYKGQNSPNNRSDEVDMGSPHKTTLFTREV